MKHLTPDRSLNLILENEDWDSKEFTTGRNKLDMTSLFQAQKCSSVSLEQLHDALDNYSPTKSPKVIRKIINEYDHIQNNFELHGKQAESLLEFFTPSKYHPLLQHSGRKFTNLISWMIASTDIYEDRSHQPRFRDLPDFCRLCKNKNVNESRRHLLSECTKTAHLIAAFSAKVKLISREKFEELQSIPPSRLWLWILGGGTIKSPLDTRKHYRYGPINPYFKKGWCPRENINKKDPVQCQDIYLEFKEMESRLPRNSVIAFTDGSFKNNLAGAGVAVYSQNKVIALIASPIGNASINYAELFAILRFLKWLKQCKGRYSREVHIFTDSKYTQDTLCKTLIPEKHFFLIEEIKNLAQILSSKFTITLNRIPSHIENTSFGWSNRKHQG